MCLCDSLFPLFRRRQPALIFPEPNKNRRVHFGQVEIREHSRVLGDHPWCRDGFSLELDWKHARKTKVVSIASMECLNRPYFRSKTAEERQELLKRVGGYTQEELEQIREDSQVKLDDLVEH